MTLFTALLLTWAILFNKKKKQKTKLVSIVIKLLKINEAKSGNVIGAISREAKADTVT